MLLLPTVTRLAAIFNMQRLLLICDQNDTSLEMKRHFLKDKQTTNVANSLNHFDDTVLSQSNVVGFAHILGREGMAALINERYAVNYPWVIFHKDDDQVFIPPTGINQQLYFYNEDTHSLYEKYNVNSVVVIRKLNMNMPLDNIHGRRADLHGLSMNVAVNSILPLYGIMRKKTTDKITMSSGDKFYRLDKDDAFGMLEDLLTVVSRELNFTVSRFQRVDGAWGTFDKKSNKSSGMIRSLVLDDMDIAWAALRMTTERKAAVNFLLPYHKYHYALVIKSHGNEKNSWSLFMKPLSMNLWTALLLHSFFLILILRIFWWYYNTKQLKKNNVSIVGLCLETVQYHFMISSSYLGNSYTRMPHNKQPTVKVILFASSIVGIVIWMSYRASLASRLSVREYTLPFSSISELADNGEYRFMIGSGGSTSVLFHRFAEAEEDSPAYKLFIKHIEPDIDSTTFDSDRDGLKHLLKMQNGALMMNYESLLVIKNPCQFAVAWKSRQPDLVAAAVPKDWPYLKIFNTKLLRLFESGTLDSIRRHWENDIPDCTKVDEDKESLALGREKLISMFILPGTGYIVSLIVFTTEMIRRYAIKKYTDT